VTDGFAGSVKYVLELERNVIEARSEACVIVRR
jgi:hypothetical protein